MQRARLRDSYTREVEASRSAFFLVDNRAHRVATPKDKATAIDYIAKEFSKGSSPLGTDFQFSYQHHSFDSPPRLTIDCCITKYTKQEPIWYMFQTPDGRRFRYHFSCFNRLIASKKFNPVYPYNRPPRIRPETWGSIAQNKRRNGNMALPEPEASPMKPFVNIPLLEAWCGKKGKKISATITEPPREGNYGVDIPIKSKEGEAVFTVKTEQPNYINLIDAFGRQEKKWVGRKVLVGIGKMRNGNQFKQIEPDE